MEEIWKDIEGYEGYYQVSNLGRVRRLDHYVDTAINCVSKRLFRGRILTPNNKERYKKVLLSKNGIKRKFYIHRLVAAAFIPNPNNYPVVNHKDENPSNNSADNLEWCTQEHNINWNDVIKRKVAPKLRKTEEEKRINKRRYIETHKEERRQYSHKRYMEKRQPKGTKVQEVVQYDKNGNYIATYDSSEEAKRLTGISHISCACNGKRLSAGGYIWKYGKIKTINTAQP